MGRRRRSRRRRRNRRGGNGKGAFKRKSARHGRTDAQMRAAAARRKNKTVKKTSGIHSPGWKSGTGQVAAWRTNWKQTKRMPSARKSSSHRVTKKRSRLGAPPKGHAPPPPASKASSPSPTVSSKKKWTAKQNYCAAINYLDHIEETGREKP